MDSQIDQLLAEATTEALIKLIEHTGLAYIHSSGCAVLKDGTWLQPEQWNQWLAHLEEVEEGEC